MPFRHLLFNQRRNGAPQRPPDQQAPSLDSQRFFNLDNEFAAYRQQWSEDNFAVQPGVALDHNLMMRDQYPAKHRNSIHSHPYDQANMYGYNTNNGVPHQSFPYDFDSNSLHYSSSDMMDTDVSSISQGSIRSSATSHSHLDIAFDDDRQSLASLSRKPSVLSTYGQTSNSSNLCPALLGNGKCDPAVCGPDAPCLQYVNSTDTIPIEECIVDMARRGSITDDGQPIDFTTPHTSPQRSRQQRTVPSSAPAIHSMAIEDSKKAKLKRPRSVTKLNATTTADPTPASKQTKARKARQAHSLVERKYRENLNAKIQELYLTLQRAQYGKPATSANLEEDSDAEEVDDRTCSKVKKSDVLTEAMDYVHRAERQMREKDEEIERLREKVQMMQPWIRNTEPIQRDLF